MNNHRIEERLTAAIPPARDAFRRELRDRLLDALPSAPTADRKRPSRRWLGLGSAAAAVSLLAILIVGLLYQRSALRTSAGGSVLDLPTLAATPTLRVVVLPGGHTPPTSRDGAKPNYDEVPAHLRQYAEEQFAGPGIEPTPGPDHATRLMIPTLGIDAPVLQGDGWDQLRKGVGQHIGTANPGQPGNVVLSAHNDIYGELFRHLDRLTPGDEVILYTEARAFTYRVTGWQVVDPTDVGVMDQTADPLLTLISCYPYLVNDQRIVVTAALQP